MTLEPSFSAAVGNWRSTAFRAVPALEPVVPALFIMPMATAACSKGNRALVAPAAASAIPSPSCPKLPIWYFCCTWVSTSPIRPIFSAGSAPAMASPRLLKVVPMMAATSSEFPFVAMATLCAISAPAVAAASDSPAEWRL